MPLQRAAAVAAVLAVAALARACSSPTPSITRPSTVGTTQSVASPPAPPPSSSTPPPGSTPPAGTPFSSCATLAPLGLSADAEGGQLVFEVNAASTCQWSAAAEGGWFAIEGSAVGVGRGRLVVRVLANAGAPRTGHLTVGPPPDGVAMVWQGAPVECRYTVSPLNESIADAGAQFAVRVTATRASCGWSAATDVPWITITEGATGAGDGRVTVTVAPNPGGARTGTLTVAGVPIALIQPGGCSYAISPRYLDVGREAATTVVTVTTAPGCAWRAVGSADWVTVAPDAGVGSGRVTVGASAAPACRFARQATVSIGSESFSVSQFVGTCLAAVSSREP